MAMVVKNNMTAINTLNILNKNTSALSKSLQKVSSGMKINSAADDASGYAISERMRVQIRSLDQANQNTQNGSSMMKVAEGAVSSTVEILKTLKEKAVNAANDSNTDSDRQTIQKELDQSIDQINDNANVTFNGKYLVDGSKNSKGDATYTVLTNQNLSTNTDASTLLTNLCARSGDSLEISTTDSITVSYVKGGKTYTSTFSVDANSTLQDIFNCAEGANDKDKIFADAMNRSVAEAMGTDVSTARDAISTADKNTYGANAANAILAGTLKYEDTEKLFASAVNETDSNAAKTFAETSVEEAMTAIKAYNAICEAGNEINVEALSQYLKPDTSDLKDGASYQDRLDFATALASDKNYQAFVESANVPNGKGTAGNSSSCATLLANAKKVVSNYDAYVKDKKKSDAAHTAVASGATVGVDANGDNVTTASAENGISITANTAGIDGQISGFTISVSDSKGNVKKSANAALDAFSETIRAQNASEDNSITLQVGASANQSIKVGLTDMRSEALGLKGADGTTLNISTQAKANAAINVLDNAIQKALDQQTTIGSVESRLEYTASNLTTASENVQSSESTIRDADMAKEMTEYTKNNVLMQAAQSMLAQANQSSSNVLSLLQ